MMNYDQFQLTPLLLLADLALLLGLLPAALALVPLLALLPLLLLPEGVKTESDIATDQADQYGYILKLLPFFIQTTCVSLKQYDILDTHVISPIGRFKPHP